MVRSIDWVDGKVVILDQTKLPFDVSYIPCDDYRTVAECIRTLRVRGAPAIGIAAAMGIALACQNVTARTYRQLRSALEPVFGEMLSTRPTAVNIRWAVERMKRLLSNHRHLPVEDLKELAIEESRRIRDEDIAVNRAIGQWGAQFIKDGDTILTHCNAGSLATGGYGTATAPLLVARDQGKRIRVIASETRPLLQGARLTAWELAQEEIPVSIVTDNSAGWLLHRGEIDLVIVGTDRTVRNGDVANKIGTYSLAVLCRENKVPFYVAAPLSSIDFSIPSGEHIPLEERSPEEVTTVLGRCPIAPPGVPARNIAFDVTPHRYITAIITERGAFRPKDIKKLARSVPVDDIRMRA